MHSLLHAIRDQCSAQSFCGCEWLNDHLSFGLPKRSGLKLPLKGAPSEDSVVGLTLPLKGAPSEDSVVGLTLPLKGAPSEDSVVGLKG